MPKSKYDGGWSGGGGVSDNLLTLRRAEFNKLMEDLGAILADVSREAFVNHISSKNMVLTGELKSAFQAAQLSFVQDYVAQVEYGFRQYGRFKDLKWAEYNSQWISPSNAGKKYDPNLWNEGDFPEVVKGMVAFITETGLENFKYVPGYRGKGMDAVAKSRAISRLAWTITASRMKVQKVRATKTKQDRNWYTDSLMAIKKQMLPYASKAMLEFMTNGTYRKLWENSVK